MNTVQIEYILPGCVMHQYDWGNAVYWDNFVRYCDSVVPNNIIQMAAGLSEFNAAIHTNADWIFNGQSPWSIVFGSENDMLMFLLRFS